EMPPFTLQLQIDFGAVVLPEAGGAEIVVGHRQAEAVQARDRPGEHAQRHVLALEPIDGRGEELVIPTVPAVIGRERRRESLHSIAAQSFYTASQGELVERAGELADVVIVAVAERILRILVLPGVGEVIGDLERSNRPLSCQAYPHSL